MYMYKLTRCNHPDADIDLKLIHVGCIKHDRQRCHGLPCSMICLLRLLHCNGVIWLLSSIGFSQSLQCLIELELAETVAHCNEYNENASACSKNTGHYCTT